jgi:hypothetical protein
MRVEFKLEGLPPRRHWRQSMWGPGEDVEAARLVELRMTALEARRRAGLAECFRSLVALDLSIFVPFSELELIGDLDNFISGVCHGLQPAPADALADLHALLAAAELREAHPRYPLLIEDDAKIGTIMARKVIVREGLPVSYQVVVEDFEMLYSM